VKYITCVKEVPNNCHKLKNMYMIDDKFKKCLRNVQGSVGVRYECRGVRYGC